MTCRVVDSVGELNAELCSNQEVVDWSGLFLMHGCAGVDQSFKSYPVILAHLNYFRRDPVLVNPSDFRQPYIYRGLLIFQP